MKWLYTPRHIFALVLVAVFALVTACQQGPAPTSTPQPPTAVVAPTLPPAPTAAPLTAAPTPVLPTQAPPPPAVPTDTATAVSASPVPTNAPTNAPTTVAGANSPVPTTASATAILPTPPPQQGALQGLYISGLRFAPDYPQTNNPITFYATIVNQTGKEQHYPVCVEIFRPDEAKSFGISSCDITTIPAGTGEVLAGTWTGSGIRECIPVRGRAVLSQIGEPDIRQVFVTLTGGELWTDFNVCP